MNGHIETMRNIMNPKNNFLQTVVTIMLILCWLIIVIGQAFGFVVPEYQNPLLVSFLSLAIGYVYGKEKSRVEIKNGNN